MKHDYYIFKSGRLKRKDNTVFLETIDGERKYLPIESIDSIITPHGDWRRMKEMVK